jgi:hypothetical protein
MEINRVHFECTLKGAIFNTSDPERPVNWKLAERPIVFHYFINWQHYCEYDNKKSEILVSCFLFRLYIHSVTKLMIDREQKVQEGKQDRISSDYLNG